MTEATNPSERETEELPVKKDIAVTTDRDTWLNSRLLKIIGIVYAIASPFVIWLVVTIYAIKTDAAIALEKQKSLEEKLELVKDLNSKIDGLKDSVGRIQIDIATIKAKANIQ